MNSQRLSRIALRSVTCLVVLSPVLLSCQVLPNGITVNQVVCTTSHPQCVWTYHNDNTRGGVNPNETAITPSTIGNLTTSSILTDGLIYAQPLYISHIQTQGPGSGGCATLAYRNMIYVVTENNTVYGIDATNPSSGFPVCFSTSLNGAEAAVPYTSLPEVKNKLNRTNFVPCNNVVAEAGVSSTPVIDINVNPPVMYVLAKTADSAGTVHERLHVFKLGNGSDLANWDVASKLNLDAFNPAVLNQRSGLALYHAAGTNSSTVYASWGSFCDSSILNSLLSDDPYTGWIAEFQMDYTGSPDYPSLAKVGAFQVEGPSVGSNEGGIWMGGAAPAIDSQNGTVLFSSANGAYNASSEWGDTVIQLSPGTPSVIDYYTPNDYADLFGPAGGACLQQSCPQGSGDVTVGPDFDLGAGGVVLLPANLDLTIPEFVAAGKEAMIYVDWYSGAVPGSGYNDVMGGLDTCGYLVDTCTLLSPTTTDCTPSTNGYGPGTLIQCWEGFFEDFLNHPMNDYGNRGSLAFLAVSAAGYSGYLYTAGIGDTLKAFPLSISSGLGTFNTTAIIPPSTPHNFAYPGSSPSISWDGSNFNNAIVWTLDTGGSGYIKFDASGNPQQMPATQSAYLIAYCAQPSANTDTLCTGGGTGLPLLLQDTTHGPGSVRFAVPTVVGGMVMVAGGNNNPLYSPGFTVSGGGNTANCQVPSTTSPSNCGMLVIWHF